MKECKYINCNILHDKRGDYCKPSHKTRQWELNNGKKNPIKTHVTSSNSSTDKFIQGWLSEMKKVREGQNNGSEQKRYEVINVPIKPTFNSTKLIGGGVAAYEVFKKKGSPNTKKIGTALLIGAGIDLLWNLLKGNTQQIIKEIPIIEERPIRENELTKKIDTPTGTRGSAVQYRQKNIPTIQFNRKYTNLLGRPPEDFFMLVHGQSGHGKSYWTIAFAEYFHRNIGKVMYYAAEQRGFNKGLQNMMNEIEATFDVEREPRKLSNQQIKEDAKNYDLIIFDSFNEMDLQPEVIKDIRSSGKSAIIGILQSTKDGKFKGDNTWLHDTDIMVQLVNRVPNTDQKQRYAANDTKVINM